MATKFPSDDEIGRLHRQAWQRGQREARDAVKYGADPHDLSRGASLRHSHLNGYQRELGDIIVEQKEA